MGVILVRQLPCLSLFWDMDQNSEVLAFCGRLEVPCFQLLSRSGKEVSGRWERQQRMEVHSILWPGLKKAFMTFIHFYQPEVSNEVPPGCKLFWEMYSSRHCQRKQFGWGTCITVSATVSVKFNTFTQVTGLLFFPHSHLQLLPFHLCFCFKEVRSCHPRCL